MKKTYVLIFGLFLLAAVAVSFALVGSSSQQRQASSPLPTPTPVTPFSPAFQASPTAALVPTGDTTTLSNTLGSVTVKNFYKKTTPLDSQGDRTLADSGTYRITYLPDGQQFLVVITGPGFDQNKTAAEQQLLSTLGISQEQACLLNVVIRTTNAANPDQAGQDYPLSFCQPTSTPTSGQANTSQVTQPIFYQTTQSLDITVGNAQNSGVHPTPPSYPADLPSAISQQFGIKVSGLYDYEVQWLWKKLWDVSNTHFVDLVRKGNVTIYEVNGTAEMSCSGTSCIVNLHHFAPNNQEGFDVLVTHELGHVIDRVNQDSLSHRSELPQDVIQDAATAPQTQGWTTSYSYLICLYSQKSYGIQLGEDYAEMIAYYLNPQARTITACGNLPNPFNPNTHPAHYKTVQEILGVY